MPNGAGRYVGIELKAQGRRPHPRLGLRVRRRGRHVRRRHDPQSGRADVVIAGGTEACIHPLPIAAFAAMMALSKRNDEPERASRPYDKGRDGFVIGEGAGVLVLESAEHAAARGATGLRRGRRLGITSDGHHIAQPDPVGRGAKRAIEFALAGAGPRRRPTSCTPTRTPPRRRRATSPRRAIRAVLGADADHVASPRPSR
jgi:3-oxoacyl-[acyl-carrier-protein] synthase II